MFGFFRSVAEAVVEKGIRGLVEDFVPGGKFVCDIAERVVEKEKARRQRAAQRAEFEQIVVLGYEAAQEQARAAFAEVIAERHLALPSAEVEAAVQWVAGIPEAARVSNRSAADPTGRTLSAAFALDTPDDVLKVLPPSPPRFLPGQAVPGRDGDWTLDRVLGAGGFGEVWLATHNDGYYDPRAVKFFFDQTGKDVIREADLVKRAMTAGQAERGRADDPRGHIVPILDVRLKGDAPWLMFEYVAGGNLSAWLYHLAGLAADARVPQVIAGLRQLCRGVGVFHGLADPLTHRDL